jgi:hypothetical protein
LTVKGAGLVVNGKTRFTKRNTQEEKMAAVENQKLEQEGWFGSCLLWFFWGVSLSFMTILSLVLLVLLAGSVALNFYFGWQLAGLELSVSRRETAPFQAPVPIPSVLAAIPTNTPMPTNTPTPEPTESELEIQLATLSAIATDVAASPPDNTSEQLLIPPTSIPPSNGVPTAVAIGTPAVETNTAPPAAGSSSSAVESAEAPPVSSAARTPAALAGEAHAFVPPQTSSNTYELITINGQRESRPAAEHGDLNIELREPQPSNLEPALVEIPGSGIDPDAINLSSNFSPDNIVATYAVHDWDWGCNCKGDLLPAEEAVLVGIKTTPGEPIFIPKKEQDIFGGNIFATLLYAAEDSLTFTYAREGSVVKGYTVHYLGLHTDPNLLALFEESSGSELPGLSLDTPVGVGSDELIVAIRDNGKFLDARSKKDWWE